MKGEKVNRGRSFTLGRYRVSLIGRNIDITGPHHDVARKAEKLLDSLLNTQPGLDLLGRALGRGPRSENAKAAIGEFVGIDTSAGDYHNGNQIYDSAEEFDYDADHDRILAFRMPAMCDRAITELHGVCAMIVADGVVDDHEISYLKGWLRARHELRNDWPVSELYDLMSCILADGLVDSDEREQLRTFLEAISGDYRYEGQPADIIFDQDPEFEFSGTKFLITGRLKLCTRRAAWEHIQSRQGQIAKSPSRSVDVLVVGDLGTKAWQFSRYGRKIEDVMNYKAAGHKILIVREKDFVAALERPSTATATSTN